LRITVISPFSFGYIDALVKKLDEYPEADTLYIETNNFKYCYNSFYDRLNNFYLKNVLNRNLKDEFVSKEIKKECKKYPTQDIILVIRPDKLETDMLDWLKSHTNKLISFYFDGNTSIPEQINLIPFFDKVYSYEKMDVEKYGLDFITNFIPCDIKLKKSGNGLFNISSYDKRFFILEKIAKQLKELNFPFHIIVRKEKPVHSELFHIVEDYISLKEVIKFIEKSSVLLDIHKENQQGLSFRVFEALGYEKKLITTNKDIVNYDFYNPQNILVIDGEQPVITKDFLETAYVQVSKEIKKKYTREFWIKRVFGISKNPDHHKVSMDL